VDNDPLQAFFYKSILERQFRDVQRVGDAAEALCLVEQPQFAGNLSLVVSEQNLPGIGSSEFVAEFHDRMPQIPVLVLGKNETRDAQPNASQSWLRFVSPPCAGEDLLKAAGELLSLHAMKPVRILN
jgi:DNA-binding NtrC family response regulator